MSFEGAEKFKRIMQLEKYPDDDIFTVSLKGEMNRTGCTLLEAANALKDQIEKSEGDIKSRELNLRLLVKAFENIQLQQMRN